MSTSRVATAARKPPAPVRWTRKEYHRLGELGFFTNRRVELLDGEVYEMSPMGPGHAGTIHLVMEQLQKHFANGFVVRVQLPLVVRDESEPEPDIAVVKGSARDFLKRHPTTAVLVVEVADTSRSIDRGVKEKLYAKAMIPEYWIVDLTTNQLEVRRDPHPRKGYPPAQVLGRDESITPVRGPRKSISVRDLLP